MKSAAARAQPVDDGSELSRVHSGEGSWIPRGARVYFVQGVDGGPIKIGTSRDVGARIADLQCASPVRLRLLGSVPGDATLERRLHRRLAHHRVHGEWFADTVEVWRAIAETVQ